MDGWKSVQYRNLTYCMYSQEWLKDGTGPTRRLLGQANRCSLGRPHTEHIYAGPNWWILGNLVMKPPRG